MEPSHLIDSNVLLDYISNKFTSVAEQRLDSIFDDSFYYSIISRMEVLGYNAPREVLLSIEGFLSKGAMYYVTDEIGNQTILIRRLLPKIKLPDVIIASTALVQGHTLLTRNMDDFKNIPSLQIDNPWWW